MKRAVLIVALVLVIGAGVSVSRLHSDSAQADPPPQLELQSNFTLPQVQAYDRYPIYFAGDTFAGLPLTSIWKEAITAPEGTSIASNLAQAGGADVSTIHFTYGTCDIPADPESELCAIPIVVQMWPACVRNPSLYSDSGNGMVPVPDPVTVRGVPAAFFEEGARLEIQAGTATIVIFDHRSPLDPLSVANALERVNGPGVPNPGQPFPQPPASALDGTLAC